MRENLRHTTTEVRLGTHWLRFFLALELTKFLHFITFIITKPQIVDKNELSSSFASTGSHRRKMLWKKTVTLPLNIFCWNYIRSVKYSFLLLLFHGIPKSDLDQTWVHEQKQVTSLKCHKECRTSLLRNQLLYSMIKKTNL